MRLGIASWIFQFTASLAAMVMSTGAMEVFLAKDESGHGGCYYELNLLEMLISIATPLLLVLTTAFKLGSLARAALYGDYLYAVSYDVPIRIVRATLPDDPAGSLLIAPISGDAEAARPKSAEAMIARRFLVTILLMRAAFNLSMYLFCLPFFVGPFDMKLAFIAQNTSMGYGPNGAVHLFLLSVVFILPALSLATLYLVLTEVDVSPVRKCTSAPAAISWISLFSRFCTFSMRVSSLQRLTK